MTTSSCPQSELDESKDGYRRGIATEDVDPKAIVIR